MRRTALLLAVMVTAVLVAFSGVALAQQTDRTTSDREQQSSNGGQAPLHKPSDELKPGRYIVVLKDNADSRRVANEHARQHGAQVDLVYEHALNGYAAQLSDAALERVRGDQNVLFVEYDSKVRALDHSSSQYLDKGVDRIVGNESSTISGNHSGSVDNVGVAVIDSGISKSHSSTTDANKELNVKGGISYINWTTSTNWDDGNGHGTHVAGTIGARDNNGGVVGMAPGVPLYAVKVLGTDGSGYTSWIIKGIDWVTANAVSKNIKVANMSIGGSVTDDHASCATTQDSYKKAICKSVTPDPTKNYPGVTYVVAAGNSNKNLATSRPAAWEDYDSNGAKPLVLTVTAVADSDGNPGGTWGASCRTDEEDTNANFSNYAVEDTDKKHTIAAPGVCIKSTWKSGAYNTISGTSMATPHVAGTAALCISTSATNGGKCTGGPSDVMADLLADAGEQPASYGYAQDPYQVTDSSKPYYGYMTRAGGPSPSPGAYYLY